MILISKGMHDAYYRPKGILKIEPLDEKLFTPNCYYFRLGAIRDKDKVVPLGKPVALGKRQVMPIFTLESFTLSDRAFSLIGSCSELVRRGLSLKHSPTIDPGFAGSLEMLIENTSDDTVTLEPKMMIGKAVFFDISDTLLMLDEYVRLETQKATWLARQEVGRMIRDWMEKKIDGGAPFPDDPFKK